MASVENKLIRRRLLGAWISTVISISLVLLLVGIASFLMVNTKSVSDFFKENMRISVLMKQEVTESEAVDHCDTLRSLPFIKTVHFVSKEEGLNEMTEMLGDDFLSVFETSPVPISADVTLMADYVSPDSLKVVEGILSSSPLVEEVVYQQSLAEKLNTNLRKISVVLGIFIALLLFISFVLINNTVRLNVFSKRFTINTMKLVGATRSFIRGPFMAQSAFQGLFSALIAILILVGLMFVLRSEFKQLFVALQLESLLVVIGIVIVSGVLICTISTYFVVNKLLSLSKDELYC